MPQLTIGQLKLLKRICDDAGFEVKEEELPALGSALVSMVKVITHRARDKPPSER